MHKRSYKQQGYTTQLDHMPEAHKRYHEQMGWDKDYLLSEARKHGPCTVKYIERMLTTRSVVEQTYNACIGILRLSKSYGPARLEAACERALQAAATSYRIVKNILINNLDIIDQNEQQRSFSLPTHDNIRGAEAYN